MRDPSGGDHPFLKFHCWDKCLQWDVSVLRKVEGGGTQFLNCFADSGKLLGRARLLSASLGTLEISVVFYFIALFPIQRHLYMGTLSVALKSIWYKSLIWNLTEIGNYLLMNSQYNISINPLTFCFNRNAQGKVRSTWSTEDVHNYVLRGSSQWKEITLGRVGNKW